MRSPPKHVTRRTLRVFYNDVRVSVMGKVLVSNEKALHSAVRYHTITETFKLELYYPCKHSQKFCHEQLFIMLNNYIIVPNSKWVSLEVRSLPKRNLLKCMSSINSNEYRPTILSMSVLDKCGSSF